jgi:hypothetical protein
MLVPMAIFYGQRTTYLQDQSRKEGKVAQGLIYILIIGSAGISAWLFDLYQDTQSPLLLVIAIGFAVYFGWSVYKETIQAIKGSRRNQGRYLSGDRGELMVAEELRRLPDSYAVLPDVMLPAKRGNFDYVVIGPDAIFLIEVKNHAGRIYASHDKLFSAKARFERDIVQQILNQSDRLDEYLQASLGDYRLVPILAFAHKYANVTVKQPVRGVQPVHRSKLADFISQSPSGPPLDVKKALQVFKPLLVKS